MLGIDLKGKKALVTGGTRGIGRATALLLARAGADVGFSWYARREQADSLVAELTALGVRSFAHQGDIAEEAMADQMVDRMMGELGGLDIFVGNAGIWPPEHVPITEMTTEQYRRTIAVNVDAIFYQTRAVSRVISNDGRIVLVSSTAGQRGEAGHADYASSKGAVISLVKSLAVELGARNVTVNSVAPGWVDTEMVAGALNNAGRASVTSAIPLGRVASAEDIAGPILFLCSSFARHITGEIVNVNGGSVLCG